MLKIGIVSSSMETIERIRQVAKAVLNPGTYTLSSFPYNDIDQIPLLLSEHYAQIDGWLFSGPNPYNIAKNFFKDKKNNSVCCHMSGNEIYKYFLEAIYQQEKKSLALSIDLPTSNLFSYGEAIEELNIPKDEIYFHEYNLPCDLTEIIAFHKKHWQKKQVDRAFTSLYLVETALQKENIPVSRIQVSNTSIKQALYTLTQKLQRLHFKNSQVAFLVLALKDYDSLVENYGNYYKLQKLDLEFRRQFLELSEHLNGYLSEKGNGIYEIFCSRGQIEENIPRLQKIIDTASLVKKTELLAGIGFSTTVYTAQLNARRALLHCRNINSSVCILDEDGKLIESAGQQQSVTIDALTQDVALTKKLQAATVSLQTYSRILSLVQKLQLNAFTAAEVAGHLGVTSRNIQRIFAGLSKAGLLLPAGQETLSKRGRPTMTYRLP